MRGGGGLLLGGIERGGALLHVYRERWDASVAFSGDEVVDEGDKPFTVSPVSVGKAPSTAWAAFLDR